MKKFSKKGVLLFAAAMAVCAFAMPSMASAASWSPIGSHNTLDATPNVGFTTGGLGGGATSSCSESFFTTRVDSAQVLTITTGAFRRCTSIGPSIGTCTTTATPYGFPWIATAIANTRVQIHNVRITVLFEHEPNTTSCTANGIPATLTGTITNATWTGNIAGDRTLDLNNSEGLVSHSPLGNNTPITATGRFRDTQNTLAILGHS